MTVLATRRKSSEQSLPTILSLNSSQNHNFLQIIRNEARRIKPAKQTSSLSCRTEILLNPSLSQPKNRSTAPRFLYDSLSKSCWPPSGYFLLVALVRRNAALNTSSSKIAPYGFSIVSSIGQNLFWSGFWPSSTHIDSYTADDLIKSPTIMFIACTDKYRKRKRI